MVAPDDATQDVERRVGAHQLMPPLPVELGDDLGVDRRRLVAGLDGVPDVLAALLCADDPPGSTGIGR
jgi:hypothetical protein